jgi:hypothetical protein
MKYLRIYADQNGDSHFEDVEIAMSLTNFAPPGEIRSGNRQLRGILSGL